MKMLLSAAAVLIVSVLSGCIGKNTEPVRSPAPAPAKRTVAALPMQKQFFLPEKLYAVPGIECNIYFRNIFLAVNPANYIFDVTCKVGRNDVKRWRFTPTAANGGKSYPLTVKIYDRNGLTAEGKTTVYVAPADAGKGKDISILIVGDSLTNATVYPTRLHTLCKQPGNPKLTMIGSHCGGGRIPVPGGVAHEGYGGWTWGAFLSRWPDEAKLQKMTPVQKNYATNKFLVLKDGKRVFDLAAYLKKYNQGKIPDVITFQLGVNDIFSAEDANLQQRIKAVLANADKLIAEFRKVAPNALIGVGYVTPGANQDAFGTNYKCGQTAWGYYRNHFRLNQAMKKHFLKYKGTNLVMIPSNVGLDTENNFPVRKEPVNSQNKTVVSRQSNGVHPAPAGYNQIGDTFYAWLKNQLAAPAKMK